MTPASIRATRISRDLTQVDFAALVGVSVGYISQIERGERTPDRATARLLAVLDVPGVIERLQALTAE